LATLIKNWSIGEIKRGTIEVETKVTGELREELGRKNQAVREFLEERPNRRLLVGVVAAGRRGRCGGYGLGGVGRHGENRMLGPTPPDMEPGGSGSAGAGGKERCEEWAAEDGRGHSKTAACVFRFSPLFSLFFICYSF